MILDSPALGAVSDALALVPEASEIVVVGGLGKTTRDAAARADQTVLAAGQETDRRHRQLRGGRACQVFPLLPPRPGRQRRVARAEPLRIGGFALAVAACSSWCWPTASSAPEISRYVFLFVGLFAVALVFRFPMATALVFLGLTDFIFSPDLSSPTTSARSAFARTRWRSPACCSGRRCGPKGRPGAAPPAARWRSSSASSRSRRCSRCRAATPASPTPSTGPGRSAC